ncbi:MAG: [LysW]-L-2-aminoadipate 6-phosphate reductase [Chloroflexi bacterium]|nr:[LysW]-L-2-aminoadipate 6-phosphate reductase [Chloroflexota bacterium]
MINASIIGASGYTGGELLRLLTAHPEVEVVQATSRKKLGEYVYQTHPNLRKQTKLKFSSPTALEPTDVLFLALPHGQAQGNIEEYAAAADYLIDLSADFRLRDPDLYREWYGEEHTAPGWLEKFIYGLPELHREELSSARYISGVGCNATASNLALLPLRQAELLEAEKPILIEIKVGSSEGGASANPGSHHPERSGVIRTYAPYGHRHTAEVIQESSLENVSLTMTSVDLIRGALATVHGTVKPGVALKDLWKAYRGAVNENPFLRLVKARRGVYRVPEPKILAGSNYADLGFDLDPKTGHVISICAIDNLMKGASGSAVQSMNLALGFEETLGLEFPGLHPV